MLIDHAIFLSLTGIIFRYLPLSEGMVVLGALFCFLANDSGVILSPQDVYYSYETSGKHNIWAEVL